MRWYECFNYSFNDFSDRQLLEKKSFVELVVPSKHIYRAFFTHCMYCNDSLCKEKHVEIVEKHIHIRQHLPWALIRWITNTLTNNVRMRDVSISTLYFLQQLNLYSLKCLLLGQFMFKNWFKAESTNSKYSIDKVSWPVLSNNSFLRVIMGENLSIRIFWTCSQEIPDFTLNWLPTFVVDLTRYLLIYLSKISQNW